MQQGDCENLELHLSMRSLVLLLTLRQGVHNFIKPRSALGRMVQICEKLLCLHFVNWFGCLKATNVGKRKQQHLLLAVASLQSVAFGDKEPDS